MKVSANLWSKCLPRWKLTPDDYDHSYGASTKTMENISQKIRLIRAICFDFFFLEIPLSWPLEVIIPQAEPYQLTNTMLVFFDVMYIHIYTHKHLKTHTHTQDFESFPHHCGPPIPAKQYSSPWSSGKHSERAMNSSPKVYLAESYCHQSKEWRFLNLWIAQ